MAGNNIDKTIKTIEIHLAVLKGMNISLEKMLLIFLFIDKFLSYIYNINYIIPCFA